MMEYMNTNEQWMNNAMKDLKPEDSQAVGFVTESVYVVMLFVGLLLCALFGSCSSHNNLTTEHKERDSVNVDVRYQTIFVPDTVFVEIPAQTAERTTSDSISHLENDYATSDARINPDGTLFHLLATKPQKKPIEVDKEIEQRDSIVYVEKSVSDTGQQIVEVERNLSWWEQTRIYGFYLLLIVVVAIYRKSIWSLFKKFILRMSP